MCEYYKYYTNDDGLYSHSKLYVLDNLYKYCLHCFIFVNYFIPGNYSKVIKYVNNLQFPSFQSMISLFSEFIIIIC